MSKPPVFDRILAAFSPARALARHVDRQRLTRAYEAASPLDTWRPRRGGASAQADFAADAATIRIKARSLVQNVPYIAAAMEHKAASMVGTGIIPTFTVANDKTATERLNSLWKRWSVEADADGLVSLDGLVKMAFSARDIDGEVLVRLRPRRVEDGLAVPLQLQLLEADWLDTTKTGRVGADVIINGIQYDPLGRRTAYWLWPAHPGDNNLTGYTVRRAGQSYPVPASEIIHHFKPQRPGASRGISCLASTINRTRDLQLYEDAELARKNLETRLAVLYSGAATDMVGPEPGAEDALKTGDLGALPSGGVFAMPAGGGSFETVEPKAAGGHVDYVKLQLHIILTAAGVPYESATGDMNEVNFSSARIRQIDFRRQCETDQWLCLIPGLCVPIARAFIETARLMGVLSVSASVTIDWTPPKWDYVNPQQEVTAQTDAIRAGFRTVSETVRQMGYDPEAVFVERAAEKKRMQELGIYDDMMALLGSAPPAKPEEAEELSPKQAKAKAKTT